MQQDKQVYRKNFTLIIAFLILISVTFIIALFIAYNLTEKYVENEFNSKDNEVLEQTTKPYYDFFNNTIPEITNYAGFLDSASAAKYSDSVFRTFRFVKHTTFYAIEIAAPTQTDPRDLDVRVKAIYEFSPGKGRVVGSRKTSASDYSDFEMMAARLKTYVAETDTAREPTQDQKFKTFYDIEPEKIIYLNIPRREDIKHYRDLLRDIHSNAVYGQNMMTFTLDRAGLNVKNTHPELYKNVSMRQVVYDPIDNDNTNIVSESPFPGAFSNYKLYFTSPHDYLDAEVSRRFMPIGAMVLLIYAFLILIGWLIYRNMNVNMRLFKLQYDFINNFTHEFKTPVSVIKIAGSNLRSDAELSERQRRHYGKILDEEADRLNDLMNTLLSFTQLENNTIRAKKEEIVIEDFVKGYIDTFRIKYPDFKINYNIQGTVKFFTDPVLLGSLFQNLMENAYKYSNPKRRELTINVRKEKKDIVFSFIDKGIGISKDEITHIFKKFYKVENQYNQQGSAGLGLAFCKELVNFMDGDITVNSKLNEGSEFIITLPYMAAE